MHLYRIDWGGPPAYRRKLADAHAVARIHRMSEVEIVLMNFPLGHGVFEDLFNGIRPQGTPLRRWRITSRGALREVPTSDEEEAPLAHQTDKWRSHHAEMSPPPAAPRDIGEAADAFWSRLNKPKGE